MPPQTAPQGPPPRPRTQAELDELYNQGQPLQAAAPAGPPPPAPGGAPPTVSMRVGDRDINLTPPTVPKSSVLKGVRFGLPLAMAAAGGARGGPPGAGAGQAVGEGMSMFIEAGLGEPPTMEQFLERVGAAPATGMWGEIGGQMAGNVVKKMAAPFARHVTERGRQAIEFLKGKVTPSQVVDSHILSAVENIAKGSIFGGGRFRTFYEEQGRLLDQKADEILNQFGPRMTMEEAGETVAEAGRQTFLGTQRGAGVTAGAITGAGAQARQRAGQLQTGLREQAGEALGAEETGKAWQALQAEARARTAAVGNELFAEVDRLAKSGGELVSLERMVQLAQAEDEKIPAMARALTGKAGQLPGVVQRTGTEVVPSNVPGGEEGVRKSLGLPTEGPVSGPAGELLQRILTSAGITPEQIQSRVLTFTQARNIRSAIGEVLGDAMRSGDSRLKGIASQFFKTLDEDMEAAAGVTRDAQGKVVGESELGKAFRAANEQWKYLKQTFDEGLLKKVAQARPHLIVDMLVKPGVVDDIVKARKAVGEDAWKGIAAEHFDSLLRDAKTGGMVDAKALRAKLTKLTPETIEAVYGGRSAAELDELANVMLNAENLEQAGRLATQKAGALHFEPTAAHKAVAGLIQKGSVKPIEHARQILGDKAWTQVQSAHAHSLLDDGGQLVSGKDLLQRLNTVTPETMAAAYPRGTDAGFWQLGRVLEQIQRKTPGTGSMYIQLAQGGAATGILLGGGSIKTAAGILLSPLMLSRVMLNPTARRWLTTGLAQSHTAQQVIGAPPREAARAATNLLSFLMREHLVPSPGRSGGPLPGVESEGGRSGGAGPSAPGGARGGGPPGPPGPPPGPPR